jgi:hypothetical protein
MTNNNTQQMELTISSNSLRPQRRRQPATRTARAAWWFSKMRQTVDQAVAWNSRSSFNH